MSERTRLDEIVEEEYRIRAWREHSDTGSWDGAARRVAERAFAEGKRVGARAAFDAVPGDYVDIDALKPDPAEPFSHDRGQNCSICHQRNSVWASGAVRGGLPLLICGNCGRCV